jgi:DNA-binding NtrC family response regulator
MSNQETILIAEPTSSLASELYSFVEGTGYHILEVRTLKETLLTLQSQAVDVLILDAILLEEDCGFITVIKGIEENLPVIICAETNTPEFESKVRQHRIFFYHIRSFGIQDLEMAISNAINKRSH